MGKKGPIVVKVLITGGSGMLASDLNSILSNNPNIKILCPDRKTLDITDRKKVEEVFSMFKPDYTIHTAALTNVDFCEDYFNEAYNINALGTENIALYSEKMGSKLVYISSCGLFGDDIKEYKETDSVVLKTKYSVSKYEGELKVRNNCPRHFIVRPGWLFGGSIKHRKNFVYARYKEAQNNPQIKSAGDKFGCPTLTNHLAKKITELLETDLYGLYHVSNRGYCSRFDYVKKIIQAFGLRNEVIEVDSSSFKRKAPVPNCEALKNENLANNGFGLLDSWEEAIEEYVHRLKQIL